MARDYGFINLGKKVNEGCTCSVDKEVVGGGKETVGRDEVINSGRHNLGCKA